MYFQFPRKSRHWNDTKIGLFRAVCSRSESMRCAGARTLRDPRTIIIVLSVILFFLPEFYFRLDFMRRGAKPQYYALLILDNTNFAILQVYIFARMLPSM